MIFLTSPVRTRAHGWPAGLKLALLCAATTLLLLIDRPLVYAALLGATLACYAAPGPEFLKSGLRGLRLLWPFVAVMLLWHAVTGDPWTGVTISLRMVLVVALANLVTMTTRLEEMTDVLRWLLTPFRRLGLPTHLLETAIPLVVRFTPVLVSRAETLVVSWRARSLRRPGWRLILPLALQALDDADHVGEALRARGGALKSDEKPRSTEQE